MLLLGGLPAGELTMGPQKGQTIPRDFIRNYVSQHSSPINKQINKVWGICYGLPLRSNPGLTWQPHTQVLTRADPV